MRATSLRLALAALAVLVLTQPALSGRKVRLSIGQTVYVPVYSNVYQGPKGRAFNLSALLSIRNVDRHKSISVDSVRYYDSKGQVVKEFYDAPVVIPPMGTTEVYIPERDTKGGSGANFTVRWKAATQVSVPIIQAIMIGTASTQGISFVCDGVAIEEEE